MLTLKHVNSERNRQRATDDYEGTVNGKPFRVQIDAAGPPHWYDSALDDDDKNEVLNEIELRERTDPALWASNA